MKKTNNCWYPSKQDGNYYRLVDGVLMSCPMDKDGSRDPEIVEVELNLFVDDQSVVRNNGEPIPTFEYLKSIEKDLKQKE